MSKASLDMDALLARAAELARRGIANTAPNPMVGALCLERGEVVGEGFHESYKGPHAEELALRAARERGARADTIVVTLEPCSSTGHGKHRPPCTELIREASVKRIVVGCEDPDPRHQGAGLEQLRTEGVEVLGPFPNSQLQALLDGFRHGLSLKRPYVYAKWAMTMDGKTATKTGSSKWISGPPALDFAHRLRAASDAVVVGMGTVLADDPELTVRRVPGDNPMRVVVAPGGEIPDSSRILTSLDQGPVAAAILAGTDEQRVSKLERAGLLVLRCAPESGKDYGNSPRIDPRSLLDELGSHGVRRVLLEGGGELCSDFLAAACIDQVSSIIAPKLCGGRAAKTPVEGDGIEMMEEALPLLDPYLDQIGDCILFGAFLR